MKALMKPVDKLKSIYHALADLVKSDGVQHQYRVVAINRDDKENIMATVQLVGKGQVFKLKPEDILSNDELTCSFSQTDIRMLTYLGYLSIHSPKYRILAQRLSEKDNKILFAIQKHGEQLPQIKSAGDITANMDIIDKLTQRDAHIIGYTLANEQAMEDQIKIQEYRKSRQI